MALGSGSKSNEWKEFKQIFLNYLKKRKTNDYARLVELRAELHSANLIKPSGFNNFVIDRRIHLATTSKMGASNASKKGFRLV